MHRKINTHFKRGLVNSKRLGGMRIDDRYGMFDREVSNEYSKELTESSVFLMPLKCIEVSARSIVAATTERKIYNKTNSWKI